MVPALLVNLPSLNYLLAKERVYVCEHAGTCVHFTVLGEISDCWTNANLQLKTQGKARPYLSLAVISASNVSRPS